MLDIKKLRELCEKAAPGPWGYDNTANMGYVLKIPYVNIHGQTTEAYVLKQVNRISEDTMAFIVAARTAMPELLNEIEWHELNQNQLEDQVDKLIDENDWLEKALSLACSMIKEQIGACPKDLYDWCILHDCPDNVTDCWERYFLEKVGEETCPNKHP